MYYNLLPLQLCSETATFMSDCHNTWNVQYGARSNPWDAKRNVTTTLTLVVVANETSSTVRGAIYGMQIMQCNAAMFIQKQVPMAPKTALGPGMLSNRLGICLMGLGPGDFGAHETH